MLLHFLLHSENASGKHWLLTVRLWFLFGRKSIRGKTSLSSANLPSNRNVGIFGLKIFSKKKSSHLFVVVVIPQISCQVRKSIHGGIFAILNGKTCHRGRKSVDASPKMKTNQRNVFTSSNLKKNTHFSILTPNGRRRRRRRRKNPIGKLFSTVSEEGEYKHKPAISTSTSGRITESIFFTSAVSE